MELLYSIFHPSHYDVNPFTIGYLLSGILILFQGAFLYSADRYNPFNRCLLYFGMVGGLWSLSLCFLLSTENLLSVYFWGHWLVSAMALMPSVFFHFSSALTEKSGAQKIFIRLFYSVSAFLVIFNWQGNLIIDMTRGRWGFYPNAGPLMYLLVFFTAAILSLSLLNFIHYHFSGIDAEKRRSTRFLMLIFLIAPSCFLDLWMMYDRFLFPLGFLALLFFMVLMTSFQWRALYHLVQEKEKYYEEELAKKSREVRETVEELKAAQVKLLESSKLSAVASLSAGILHQLSQPITAIHGFVKFLKKEMPSDNPFYKPIVMMEEQSVYIKQMLTDLMEIIRHREIKKENIQVNEALQRAFNLLTDELRIWRVLWDFEPSKDLPLLYADSIHLQHIFMNIVISSIQTMNELPKGDKKYLRVTTGYSKETKEVVIVFRNTGLILSETMPMRMFEPTYSTKSKGGGIGLALSYDLIAEHGGTIDVESTAGQGTTFTIKLPCLPVSDSA